MPKPSKVKKMICLEEVICPSDVPRIRPIQAFKVKTTLI